MQTHCIAHAERDALRCVLLGITQTLMQTQTQTQSEARSAILTNGCRWPRARQFDVRIKHDECAMCRLRSAPNTDSDCRAETRFRAGVRN